MRKLALFLTLLFALPAGAEDRLDHRGALGLELGAGIEHASVLFIKDSTNVDANRLTVDLAPTVAIGTEGNELVGTLRLLKGPDLGGALGFAYRSYFGRDELKTFFQLGLKADSAPHVAIGPDANLGGMYELSSLFGVFASAGLSMEVGHGLRVGFAAAGGVQLRSYVLE